jgi:hypothetical protein
MDSGNFLKFIKQLSDSIENKSFAKLILSNKRNKKNDLNSVTARIVEIKKGVSLSFVYRYPTKDVTKNYLPEESISIIEKLLKEDFLQAELYTSNGDLFLNINKNNSAKLKEKSASVVELPSLDHDKNKSRMIRTENNIYLKELGILNAEGTVKNNMQDKFKQINKYIEIIDGIVKSVKFDSSFNVVDMGAGKGYLTFTLYDYLHNTLKLSPNVIGVELRKQLVEDCNLIAEKSSFANLKFIEGTIEKSELPTIDMLIALHACDTATDDAICRGITSNSKVIICAPCCHKQIRGQMNSDNDLRSITQFGILKERQAEIITDTIRAMILEAYGYETNVFEFIDTEHTPKNILIVGVKEGNAEDPKKEILDQVQNIKKIFGIEFHYLEKLMNKA